MLENAPDQESIPRGMVGRSRRSSRLAAAEIKRPAIYPSRDWLVNFDTAEEAQAVYDAAAIGDVQQRMRGENAICNAMKTGQELDNGSKCPVRKSSKRASSVSPEGNSNNQRHVRPLARAASAYVNTPEGCKDNEKSHALDTVPALNSAVRSHSTKTSRSPVEIRISEAMRHGFSQQPFGMLGNLEPTPVNGTTPNNATCKGNTAGSQQQGPGTAFLDASRSFCIHVMEPLMHVADAKRDATRGIQESHTAAALSPDTYLDQKPAGGAVPETNAGMLEHMLGIGVVDCDTPYTATAGTYAGQPDTAEQTQGTRSHPTGAAAGHDRSQISQQSGTAGHRKPQGTSGPRHKQGAKGLNSEKRQQTLARQREYQALYRAKNRDSMASTQQWISLGWEPLEAKHHTKQYGKPDPSNPLHMVPSRYRDVVQSAQKLLCTASVSAQVVPQAVPQPVILAAHAATQHTYMNGLKSVSTHYKSRQLTYAQGDSPPDGMLRPLSESASPTPENSPMTPTTPEIEGMQSAVF